MPDEKIAFAHTDGRIFTHTQDTPHKTRDGRDLVLRGWEMGCSHPDCDVTITVRTATFEPWTWPNFKPPKFCKTHRAHAIKANQARFIKARADGLARWRESKEGKESLAQRKMNHMGGVERLLYDTAAGLALIDGNVQLGELFNEVEVALPLPPLKARDTRRFRIKRALERLMDKGWLNYRCGVVTIARVLQEKPTKKERRKAREAIRKAG